MVKVNRDRLARSMQRPWCPNHDHAGTRPRQNSQGMKLTGFNRRGTQSAAKTTELKATPTGQADASLDAAQAAARIISEDSLSPLKVMEARKVCLPWAQLDSSTCFTVDGLLSEEECEALVALSESRGYVQALVNVGGGKQILIEVRSKAVAVRRRPPSCGSDSKPLYRWSSQESPPCGSLSG